MIFFELKWRRKLTFEIWYEVPQSNLIYDWCMNLNSPDVIVFDNSIREGFEDYCITSPHLLSCSDIHEVADRARALEALLNGAIYLFHVLKHEKSWEEIKLNSAFAGGKDANLLRKDHLYIPNFLKNPFCDEVINEKIKEPHISLENDISLMIFQSRYDKTTRDILIYTGYNKLSYLTLYAYKDWMNKNAWDKEKIISETGWSAEDLKRFTQTVNNPVILGPMSRHGGSEDKVSEKFEPMPLNEARKSMGRAMISFLEERSHKLNVKAKLESLKR